MSFGIGAYLKFVLKICDLIDLVASGEACWSQVVKAFLEDRVGLEFKRDL